MSTNEDSEKYGQRQQEKMEEAAATNPTDPTTKASGCEIIYPTNLPTGNSFEGVVNAVQSTSECLGARVARQSKSPLRHGNTHGTHTVDLVLPNYRRESKKEQTFAFCG
jgi:hypothetical protein